VDDGLPCYLYGVVRAADAEHVPRIRGVAGSPVGTIATAELAAVVSQLHDVGLRANRADLLAHADVLQEVVDRCDVVPVRFGQIYARPEHVRRRLLHEGARSLHRLLDELADRIEIQVKATYDEPVVVAELVRGDRRLQKLRARGRDHAGQIELGRRFEQVLAARRDADAAHLLKRLGKHADRASVGDAASDFAVVDAAFLVRRGSTSRFLAEVDRLATESPAWALRAVGPMAPYSFVGDATVRAA